MHKKRMSTSCGEAGHQEIKDLAPGKECEPSLTARRGKCRKSLIPEKENVVKGDSSKDKKQISPQNKTKYSSRAFTDNGSGDQGIAFDKQEGSQQYKMLNTAGTLVNVSNDFSMVGSEEKKGLSLQHQKIYEGIISHLVITVDLSIQVLTKNRELINSTTCLFLVLLIAMVCFNIGICTFCEGNVDNEKKTKRTMEDCVLSVTDLVPKEPSVKVLTSTCDIFACISEHDLTTQTLCQFMWRKWFAFRAYNTCLVTCYSAYLIPNGCMKHTIALINAFIGWTSARMRRFVLATRRTTTHVLFCKSHIPAPNMMRVKFQRKRFFKRSSTTMILAVMITVPTIGRSQAQQVSLQF